MRYQDVLVGQSYRVKDHFGRGRAVVTGPGVKNRLNGRYRFPVQFPDFIPRNEQRLKAEMDLEAADFRRLWTMEDQQEWEQERRESAELRAITDGLTAAGYRPDRLHSVHRDGNYWLSFSGDTTQDVIETLMAHPKVTDAQKELEQ